MPQKSKVKTDVYQDAPVSFVSQATANRGSSSMSVSMESRKKQAEEPIYLNRM